MPHNDGRVACVKELKAIASMSPQKRAPVAHPSQISRFKSSREILELDAAQTARNGSGRFGSGAASSNEGAAESPSERSCSDREIERSGQELGKRAEEGV